ncbi:MAG: L,D-transpeptidase family protein, partial [Candidatus Zixiibacteriota bacterium]
MNSARRYIKFILIPVFMLVAAVAFIIGAKIIHNPPAESLPRAYDAITKARAAGAMTYAPKAYADAMSLVDKAEKAIAVENDKLVNLRSFEYIDSLIDVAVEKAALAVKLAGERKKDESSRIKTSYRNVNARLSAWKDSLDASLVLLDGEKLWTEARTHCLMAENLLERGAEKEAKTHIAMAGTLLDQLKEKYHGYRKQNAENGDTWKKWADQTRKYSKDNKAYAIIVDKGAHELYLLKDGKVRKTYKCDLGYNSAYQKVKAHDGTTPEGMYHVTKVNRHSKYYIAFLLNYPNEADKARFARHKAEGRVDDNAKIGGLIEIHGDGGQGRDWTDGCVAV